MDLTGNIEISMWTKYVTPLVSLGHSNTNSQEKKREKKKEKREMFEHHSPY